MAGRSRNGSATVAAPEKPARALKRKYTVVRIDGPSQLTVLDPEREAKNATEACDAVADTLKPEDRNVELGAFLTGSFHQRRYRSEQEWTTKSEERSPAFLKSPAVA